MKKRSMKGWLYLLPAMLFLGAFMVYPLIDVLVYSFEEGYNSASQTYFGMRPAKMTAVFSLSTSATGLSGCSLRRCSPNRHCVRFQEAGSCPAWRVRAQGADGILL